LAANVVAMSQSRGLRRLMQYSDILLALAVVVVVGMLIIPFPDWLLDVLITVNISVALIVLLVSMYILEPLQFSAFPSLLLVATLFRLGLNISATRLILLNANAGKVIASFGQFVVGGNYVVGIVVFIILVVIQFVVITNGAGRVAEVAARFTLDAMPGKQMSIDAENCSGSRMYIETKRTMSATEMLTVIRTSSSQSGNGMINMPTTTTTASASSMSLYCISLRRPLDWDMATTLAANLVPS